MASSNSLHPPIHNTCVGIIGHDDATVLVGYHCEVGGVGGVLAACLVQKPDQKC
jgi:hypothetical protein